MTKEITAIDKAKKLIINNEKAFEAVLPKNFDVKKFIATFCLEVQKNPKLAECTNLIEVARDVANFGLVIGGLANQAHLIPYQNYKTKEYTAQLIIGYRGYITKLEEAGYSIETEIVTQEEVDKGFFQEIRGSETKIIHNPIRKGIRTRENIALAYCIIKGNNAPPVISVLSKEEIEEIGKTSQWVNNKKEIRLSNVWLNNDRITDFGQQCIKTVIRNCVKKVNLRIANEMSAYEGQKEEEVIRNITPKSKTANAHDISIPPASLLKPDYDLNTGEVSEEVKEIIDAKVEETVEELIKEDAKAEEIFDRISGSIKAVSNMKALATYLTNSKADLEYLEENKPQYFAEIQAIENNRLEELAGNE